MISIVLSNSSPAQPPWGGRKALLGASPLAAGAPSGYAHPFVLDMAMTVAARGKMRLAAERGDKIPTGIALDKHGRVTTDGMEAFHGTVLPAGGYKGTGITILIEILAGVLTGAGFAGKVSSLYNDFENAQNVGHFIVAIRPDLFMPIHEFRGRMDTLVEVLKAQPLAEGFEEILLSGEPESRQQRERMRTGVPLQRSTVEKLLEVAEELDIDFPRGVPVGSTEHDKFCSNPNCLDPRHRVRS